MEAPALTAYHQHVLQVARALPHPREVLQKRLVYDGDARARVFEVVAVVVRREQRVDHRDDAAHTVRAEPTPDELRAIGERNQHAVFRLDSRLAQSISRTVRHTRRLRVRETLFAVVETDLTFAPFLKVVVEEVFAHLKAFGEFDVHVRQFPCGSVPRDMRAFDDDVG